MSVLSLELVDSIIGDGVYSSFSQLFICATVIPISEQSSQRNQTNQFWELDGSQVVSRNRKSFADSSKFECRRVPYKIEGLGHIKNDQRTNNAIKTIQPRNSTYIQLEGPLTDLKYLHFPMVFWVYDKHSISDSLHTGKIRFIENLSLREHLD